jgi:hypothetical protein
VSSFAPPSHVVLPHHSPNATEPVDHARPKTSKIVKQPFLFLR